MNAQDAFEIIMATLGGAGTVGWWLFRRHVARIDKLANKVDRMERVHWKMVRRLDALILANGGRIPRDDDDVFEES